MRFVFDHMGEDPFGARDDVRDYERDGQVEHVRINVFRQMPVKPGEFQDEMKTSAGNQNAGTAWSNGRQERAVFDRNLGAGRLHIGWGCSTIREGCGTFRPIWKNQHRG